MSQDLRQYKNEYFTKISCSMCQESVDKNNTFIPSECLIKHGMNGHRICKVCWWDSVIGFAREYSSHKCPGCIKDLPLTEYENLPPIFVDLTEE
jgi:hypothetical protein